jgi:hypothetical protein
MRRRKTRVPPDILLSAALIEAYGLYIFRPGMVYHVIGFTAGSDAGRCVA